MSGCLRLSARLGLRRLEMLWLLAGAPALGVLVSQVRLVCVVSLFSVRGLATLLEPTFYLLFLQKLQCSAGGSVYLERLAVFVGNILDVIVGLSSLFKTFIQLIQCYLQTLCSFLTALPYLSFSSSVLSMMFPCALLTHTIHYVQ